MAIVCHRYGFVFVKTRKTAGSSVEIALSRLCSAQDFVTPLSFPDGPDERLRREAGGQPPVNWRKRWWQYRTWKEVRHRLKHGKQAMILGTHATAEQLRAHVGQDAWERYLTFTVERNPWDKAVSRYWWMKYRHERRHGTAFEPISAFLSRVARERPHWLTNWDHYASADRILVDRVLFYERLQEDLVTLEAVLDAPAGSLELPRGRAKGGIRKDRRPYSEVLSKSDRDLIARVCHREIEAFGYRFE
ncbi:MAG: hypothetical protein FKY71_12560 [Spiribacter salinus]|uniref:Sulfotransferase family protein n=1 Tax=Spiribacter salinus TaxID=1335746 RepID=A0A540VPH6_9GAMM|nr:MAG: hypothetical protein FKY71_12560 [Spiribacter salinus]